MGSVKNISKGVFFTLALIAVWWWWVTSSDSKAEQRPRKTIQHQETKVSSVLQLPGADGVVYVIESPADEFGFEVNSCMLHIKGGASTMACTPPKMKFIENMKE